MKRCIDKERDTRDTVTTNKYEFDSSFLSIHFDDEKKETVSCKHCQLSFPSNDKKQLCDHLITTHKMTFKMQDSLNKEDLETDNAKKIDMPELQPINMALIRKTSKRSKSWRFFTKVDQVKYIAKCNICHTHLRYRSSVTNLMCHIKNKHPYALEKEEMSRESDTEYIESKYEIDSSIVLNNYNDDGDDTVTCKHCQVSFTSNDKKKLSDHLITSHDMIFSMQSADYNDDRNDIPEMQPINTLLNQNTGRRSKAWRFFTNVNPAKFIAKCNICNKKLSYKSSVTNLIHHVRRKHPFILKTEAFTRESDMKDGKQINRSMLKYFKCLDEAMDLYQCYTCQERLPMATAATMKEHIKNKHPNIVDKYKGHAKVIISTDGQLYEVQEVEEVEQVEEVEDEEIVDQNNTYPFKMDTVYLEDYSEDETPAEMQEQKVKRRKTLSETNPDTSSSDESIVHSDRSKEFNTVDLFGKYITSLLKQLPHKVSNKLQADFVRQTLEAQVECERKKPVIDFGYR